MIILQSAALYFDTIGKRTCSHILSSLLTSLSIHINTPHLRLREALRHHQRNESGTRPDIQNAFTARCPCPQQHTIRSHFHGATILMNLKLFEFKSSHSFTFKIVTQKSAFYYSLLAYINNNI